ncbi:MAG: CBS domain-containing protein [Candidatus Altiarchaeota archaeon]|nr:CBS domain-containing protein [Candidatus Altiarchaeota archaeon]
MKYSYRIFRLFGISVELHITFIFFLLLISVLGLPSLIFFISIFLIVLMHEFSHSLVAMGFDIPVPRIVLTPIGGLASIEVPEDPKKEIVISIAGPLSNFVLAAIVYAILVFTKLPLVGYWTVIQNFSTGSATIANPAFILSGMLWVNLMLGLFNTVPGFPMDGGRVFRAMLALWMDYIHATKIAVHVGQFIAFMMVMVGLLQPHLWLILIGVFLYYAGNSELQIVKIKHSLRGLTVGNITVRDIRHVNESTSVGDFIRLIARPGQDYYPVTEGSGRIIGILGIEDLRVVSRADLDKINVRGIMTRGFNVMDARLEAEKVIGKILGSDFLLVVDSDRVVGYTTPESVFEAARFHTIKGRL